MDQWFSGRKAGETMIRITQIKLRPEEGEDLLLSKICKKLKISEKDIESWQITKKSIDARKKEAPVFVYQVDVKTKKQEELFFKHGASPGYCGHGSCRAFLWLHAFPGGIRPGFTGAGRPCGGAGRGCGAVLENGGFKP